MLSHIIDKLRAPETTGPNRCWPCTAANLLVATVVAVAVGRWVNPPAGAGVLVVAGVAVWLRGYVVPGTPSLVKRYVPDRVVRAFERDRDPIPVDDHIDADALLREAGVVRSRPGGALELDPTFEADWTARMYEIGRDTDEAVALGGLLGVSPGRVERWYAGPALTARVDGRRVGQWESRAALVADVAAGHVLATRLARWGDVRPHHRTELIGALRPFISTCPSCEGEVTLGQTAVPSCCGPDEVIAATCLACDARLFELELTGEFEAALTG